MEIATNTANTNSTKKTYTCKFNRGWNRIKGQIMLKNESLDFIIRMIKEIPDEKFNRKTQNEFKNYFQHLPPEVIFDINRRCVTTYCSMKATIRTFSIFPPPIGFKSIDLVGSYKGTDCCTLNTKLWFWGFNSDRCLSKDETKIFQSLISKSVLNHLISLSLWPREEVIEGRIIKKILTNAPFLRSLTLRGAVDDSILLTLAKSCPLLMRMDFARSLRITDSGLKNLSLLQPKRRIKMNEMIKELISFSFTSRLLRLNNKPSAQTRSMNEDWNTFHLKHVEDGWKTSCVKNLQSVRFSLNSKVTNAGLQVFGLIMDIGYRVPNPPDVVVFRPKYPRIIFGLKYQIGFKLNFLKEAFERNECEFIWSDEEMTNLENVLKIVLNSADQSPNSIFEIDLYKLPNGNFEIYARKLGCLYIRGFFELKLSPFPTVTKLIMPWESFSWSFRKIVTLSDLALYCPNIKNIKGRVTGNLDSSPYRFRFLQFVEIWTLEDTTIVSLLTRSDNLKILDVKNVRVESDDLRKLNDDHINEFIDNHMIPESLEEFIIRPTDISSTALKRLISACPNMKRIGDLECWSINNEEIEELNQELRSANSKCSLIVSTFPPRLIPIPGFEY